jgi:hypothetical protein
MTNFKVGDIFFCYTPKSVVGFFIHLYNKITFKESQTTHVGIITKVEKDRVLVYESVKNGFLSSWYEINWINNRIKEGKIKIKRTKRLLTNVHKECEKYHGIPYGFFDIFKITLYTLFGYKGIYWTGARALICSEAVSRVLYDSSDGHIQLGYNPCQPSEKEKSEYKIPYDLISPMHIFKSKYLK